MLRIFSRARPSLKIQSANRVFKSMILPILGYCGAVFHRCGKGNEKCLESLQRRGGRIVLNAAHPFTKQMYVYKPRLGHSYEEKREPYCLTG